MPRHTISIAALLVGLLVMLSSQSGFAVDWVTVTGDGKFAIQMPGIPQERHQNVNTNNGRVDLHMYTLVNGNSEAFSLTYADFAGEAISRKTPQQFLQEAETGALNSTKGKLRSSRDIKLGSWPGRAFISEESSGHVYTSYLYLVGNRLYQILAATGKSDANGPVVTRFLESFKVNGK